MNENRGDAAPVQDWERLAYLDVVRGVALFGVMWINLLTEFRVSLFEHLLVFHTHPGWMNEWIDLVSAWLIEYKAFAVFSFLFGVGIAVQTERHDTRAARQPFFMLRRFGVLLYIGLFHMFFIWNGDILCLYAVCGLFLIGFRRLPVGYLIPLSLGAFSLRFAAYFGSYIPDESAMHSQALKATEVYGHGSFGQIFEFRGSEALHFTMPLLLGVLPQTISLMLLGIASWRSGILKNPKCRLPVLGAFFLTGTLVGGFCTSLIFWSASSGRSLPLPPSIVEAFSSVPLALGLASGLVLWLVRQGKSCVAGWTAAAGRMALTNYLMQSMVFGLIFHGFGLIGRLSPSFAAMIGIPFFGVQLAGSRWWLRRFRFGPAEWLWRSLTYGYRQPMKRNSAGSED